MTDQDPGPPATKILTAKGARQADVVKPWNETSLIVLENVAGRRNSDSNAGNLQKAYFDDDYGRYALIAIQLIFGGTCASGGYYLRRSHV